MVLFMLIGNFTDTFSTWIIAGSPQLTTICLAVVQSYDGAEQGYWQPVLEVAVVLRHPGVM